MKLLALLSTLFLAGCAGIPEGVSPVQGFEPARYLGAWYEIARLDHSFERGLTRVTATYSLRENGGINVVNRGFDAQKQEWREATGKAYFVESPDIGRLKVSFFGPFYGGYNIIELDKENYAYALVSGPTRSYLWILARDKTLDSSVLHQLVTKAEALGFATDHLIYVDHADK
ncbi:outer membrane lipoprotein blc [Methylocaldum marinum]|uniref:Outer membrane lipoprotein Blc n=1 Tax=Methylocaldum marinum TaxID=1432792 RepID=A0A250KYN0_9GAMM|nr:lipocalin family protein [Methylocaldum marinum]BBA36788.1 outer membrane lipoprotein blc [Methylocaldum marinum]